MKYDFFEIIYKRIPRHIKVCFTSGMIVGLITHFYMLTHKFTNWDDINSLAEFGSGDYLGRWFLKYIHPLGSKYSIPAVHGFLMILFLALASCLIISIIQVNSTTCAILIPAVMATFPSVVSTMTFMFMAHTSGAAIFMTCLAVYLLRKYKWGYIPCTVLLICVMGVYQSYIAFAITLMLMGLISDVFHGKEFKNLLLQGILYVAVLIIGVLIYMEITHMVNPNLENETYGGVANMGKIDIKEMPTLIGRCYKRFLEFFIWKPFAFVSKVAQISNIFVCGLAFILFGVLVKIKNVYKNVLVFLILVMACGFMPLAAAFIYFMAPEVEYSMLMLYPYALIYVTVLALLEYIIKECAMADINSGIKKISIYIMMTVTLGTIIINCYSNYLLTNRAYMRTEFATERAKAYFNRIISYVEQEEGFCKGDKISILGEFYYKDNPSEIENGILDSEDLRELSGVALENGLITSGVRENFIYAFLGYESAPITWDEKERIMGSKEYADMKIYPEEGCVKKINGIWVVKMCN